MRVLYDHQIFELQRWGGISRYFVELMTRLAARPGVTVEAPVSRTLSEHRAALHALGAEARPAGFQETFLGGARVPFRRGMRGIARRVMPGLDGPRLNRERSLDALRRGGQDVFHPTYYDPYFLEALGGRPYVITVHDLAHEVWPELFSGHDATTRAKAEVVRGARRVIAISASARDHAVALLGLDPARVDVIHHGYSRPDPGAAGRQLPGLPGRFVLYTGQRGAYKNWAFAARALTPLLRDADLVLLCTGPAFSPRELDHLEDVGAGDRIRHHAVAEEDLTALYSRAIAFVFPSLLEGFGLPVLEAMGAGCPSALARAGALPEVGGDAALYFDPKDAVALREAVGRIVADRALRADLVRRGLERVRAFTWESSIERHLETYRRAVE